MEAEPVESAAEQTAQLLVTEEQELQSETKPEAQRLESPKVSPEPEAKPESDAKSELDTVVNTVPPPESKDSTPEPQHSHDTPVQEPVPPPSISTAISQLPAESLPAESEGIGSAMDRISVERVKESSVERSHSKESSPVVSSVVPPTTDEPAEHIEPGKPENGYPESGSEDNGKCLRVLCLQ